MAHMIETMAYVGETPWHRLGTKIDGAATMREALAAAGLDWHVDLKPLYVGGDDGPDMKGEKSWMRGVIRSTDGKLLGCVGNDWTPVQPAEAFAWFDPFIQSGEARIETAGSLFGGRRIWALAKLNRDPAVIVPGDEINKYVLLATAFDGTLSARAGFTPVRVVCANTMAMAERNRSSKLLRIRHTKNVLATLDVVRDIMNRANGEFEATADQYRLLAHRRVNSEDLAKYVNLVFRKTETDERLAAHEAEQVARDAVAAASANSNMLASLLDKPVAVRDDANDEKKERANSPTAIVTQLLESATNTTPGAKGTLWGAYNAVSEFITHHRGKTEDARANAQAFGETVTLNQHALDTALSML
jgi:phage/plasmid-like protein (TIGR03299 family)